MAVLWYNQLMDANRNQQIGQPGEVSEDGVEAFEEGQDAQEAHIEGKPELVDIANLTKMRVSKVEKGLKKAKNQPVEIMGQTVDYPGEAWENFQAAYEMVKEVLPIKKKDIYFTSFEDSKVGLSTPEGVYIDAVVLMHPVSRIAHILGHEFAHRKKRFLRKTEIIHNEAIVEEKIRLLGLGGKMELSDNYKKMMGSFSEFINRVQGDEEKDVVIKKIVDWYYKGKTSKIYNLYKRIYVKKLPKEEQDNAIEFYYNDVFPDQEYENQK